jgi:hypothetical protein
VTTGVISGPLSITAPASAALGSGPPGTTIGSSLGTVQVTDGRGFGADWTTAVSSSDFTINGGGPAETIPVGDASYAISGLATATGPATFGYVPEVGLTPNPQDVVDATNVDGNTTVIWNPVVQVAVPGGAVGGPTPLPSSTPCPERDRVITRAGPRRRTDQSAGGRRRRSRWP